MVKLSQKNWMALVAFFRGEEKIMRDSFGEPGRKSETWIEYFRQNDPEGYERYERARKAIASAQRRGR